MGTQTTYARFDVAITIARRDISGTAGKIGVAFDGEDVSAQQDDHGSVVFSEKQNKIASFSIPVLQEGVDNDYLSGLRRKGVDFQVKNMRGTTIVSGRGMMKKPPDLGFDEGAEVIEWEFLVSVQKWHAGKGNAL